MLPASTAARVTVFNFSQDHQILESEVKQLARSNRWLSPAALHHAMISLRRSAPHMATLVLAGSSARHHDTRNQATPPPVAERVSMTSLASRLREDVRRLRAVSMHVRGTSPSETNSRSRCGAQCHRYTCTRRDVDFKPRASPSLAPQTQEPKRRVAAVCSQSQGNSTDG